MKRLTVVASRVWQPFALGLAAGYLARLALNSLILALGGIP